MSNEPWKSGDIIEAVRLEFMRQLPQRIRGGNGIKIRRTGDDMIIEAEVKAQSWVRAVDEAVAQSAVAREINSVDDLPAIPGSNMLEVFWTSDGDGTGDDQVWRAYAGQTAWTPTQATSSLSGVPV